MMTQYGMNGPDPMRFQGQGQYFKAKMIGTQEVEGARGDRLCQDTMGYLKQRVKAAGVHKPKITLNISLKGITIYDLLSGNVLHQHSVSRISFISRDTTDARAFGYIYGPGDGTHVFYAIKTEKAAEPVVLTLRDLFLVVFEMKKKEVEESKKKKEENKENHKEKENNVEQKEEEPEFRNPPIEQAQEASLFDLDSDFGNNTGQTGQGFVDMNFFGTAQAPPATPGSATSDPFSSSSGSAAGAFPAGGFEAAFPAQQQAPNLPPRPGAMPGAFPQQAAPPPAAGGGAWATFTPSPPPGAAGAFPAAATTSPSNPFANNTPFPTSSSGNNLFGAAPLEPAANAAPSNQPPALPKREDMFSDLVGAFGTGLESKPAKPKDEMFSPDKDKTPMSQMTKPATTEPAQDDPFGMFAALGPAPTNAPPPTNSGTSNNNIFGNDLFG